MIQERHGFINGELVLRDGSTHPDCDDGTIWTNMSGGEVNVCINGEQKSFRLDRYDGVEGIQRVITRIESSQQGFLIIYYVDLSITDGIVTVIGPEGNYEIGES